MQDITCRYCNAKIGAGEQRWAGREPEEFWHYGCAEIAHLVGLINPFGFKPPRRAGRHSLSPSIRAASMEAPPLEHARLERLLEEIRRYQALLGQELDPAARAQARRLLAEAEAELRACAPTKEAP